jgi:hypothetical protein
MSQFTIDNTRSVNKNSRNNYARGDKNTFVYSTSEFEETYINPNRIQYKYQKYLTGDDRYWLNEDFTLDKTQYIKRDFSTNEINFGIQNYDVLYLFPLQINMRKYL